jgi:methyl-accepting chemotaxis protein
MLASATHQPSAAVAQIEQSARLAESNGKLADQRVRAMDAALKSGRQSVDSLIRSVSQGMEEARAAVGTVASLAGVARNIEKIVDAIALVTLQTAMLAVSGAVEAARAGESGRGFAIVSNDIRSLAREATSNIERSKETVRSVLDQITLLRNELDQIASIAGAEVQNNRAVTTLLEKMEADVTAMGQGSAVIVEGATTILRATTEAAKGARQVASAAEQASAASRQAATAATEQARAAEDLAGAIEEIASLADELKRSDG